MTDNPEPVVNSSPDNASLGPAHSPLVSIVVCTSNRADSLRNTLAALDRVRIPRDWDGEIILVDNASTDNTAAVARDASHGRMNLRYVYERKRGLSHARNAGVAHARGDFVLFTDDDALPAEDWIEQMVSALRQDGCDGVTGRFVPADYLSRSWATPMHRWWLGDSDVAETSSGGRELIGGNMGFRRSVFAHVRAFDPELGAGALGFGEDTLFGWQMTHAGLGIGYAPGARVIHECDTQRLQRGQWLIAARKRGRSEAYFRYHWAHDDIRMPRLKWLFYLAKLHARRVLERPPSLDSEGCPLWEMSYVLHMEMCRHFCAERRRPRNYARFGTSKRVTPPAQGDPTTLRPTHTPG